MGAFFGGLTFGISGTGNGISDCNLAGSVSDIIQSTGIASSASTLSSATYNGGLTTFSGTGTGTAQYGAVGAGASGTLTGTAAGGTAESVGYGIASDTMSFNPGAGAGTTGYAVLQYSISGSLTMNSPTSGDAAAEVAVQVGTYGPQDIFYSVYNSGLGLAVEGYGGSTVSGCIAGTSSFTCINGVIATSMMPVTFNTPTDVTFGFYAGVDGGGVIDPDISLTGITLYTAGQQEISNFTITSDSGTQYGADGVESSPEPTTLLLAAGALSAFAWARRGRKDGIANAG
jgi:hypothetical protein